MTGPMGVDDEDDFLSYTPVSSVPSPCINVCRLKQGVCEGCHRTAGEITEWSNASDTRKQAILDRIATL